MCPWFFTLVWLVISYSCWPPVWLAPCGTDPDKLVLWVVSSGLASSTNLLSLQIEAHSLPVCFNLGYPFHQQPSMGCHSLKPYLVAHRAFFCSWWVSPSHFYQVVPWAGPAVGEEDLEASEACTLSSEVEVYSVEMESRPPARRINTNQREPVSSLNWTLLLFCLWDLEEFGSLCWIIFQIYPTHG